MNLTLYIHKHERNLVERARRLLQFHEGTTLSREFVATCERVVRKYEVNWEANGRQRAGIRGVPAPTSRESE